MTTQVGVTLAAIVLGLPVFFAAGYLAMLAALSFFRRPAGGVPGPKLRFRLIVPAHDEAAGIGRTVHSLLALEYPAELRRVWVVADNCSDETAEVAAGAGAEVLVRTDAVRRGKGYALALAFEHCLAEGWADAVVVVDADTVVQPNLLSALAERFNDGTEALQVHYGILEDRTSWRVRLLKLSFALFHGVRSAGRERLGLSCGLRGNGMAFRSALLARVPHRAFSIVEDLEYGLDLGAAGVRVGYVDATEVLGEMPSGEAGARLQRRRWEGGRAQLRRRIPGLLALAARRRDWVLADLALDLALPPLSTLCLWAGAGSVAGLVGVARHWLDPLALVPWLAADLCLLGYVLRGWAISGVGGRGLLDLAWAPFFVAWKLLRLGSPIRERTWVRTARDRR